MKLKNTIALLLFVPLVALAKPQVTGGLEIYKSPNIKVYAFEQVLNRWGDEQWSYFNDLIDRESTWDHLAQNPGSTAFGLGQFLDSTWSTVGCEKTEDKYQQIDCTIKYIDSRYGTPSKAIEFHNKRNWY